MWKYPLACDWLGGGTRVGLASFRTSHSREGAWGTRAAQRQPPSHLSARRVATRRRRRRRRGRGAVRRAPRPCRPRGRPHERATGVLGDPELARAADRDARAVGRERGTPQKRSRLRQDGVEAHRASHRHAEQHHQLRGFVPEHPGFGNRGRVRRRCVQLADRSQRIDLRRPLGAELSRRVRCTTARRWVRTCGAGTRCTTTPKRSVSR